MMAERALVAFFGGKKGSTGAFFWLCGGVSTLKRVCGGIFLALWGRFYGKKGLWGHFSGSLGAF